jgi:DNA-binding beta-propeller fold protein YncE
MVVAPVSAIPFAAVNINPVPDTLVEFDSSNPAAGTTTVTFPTELVRGMDLTGPTTGWYVSTSGAASGFYRLTNGVSTLIGPMPFASTDLGGLTFNQNESFLYYIIDEQGTPTDDVLYRVAFDGTFTRLGLINGIPSASQRFGGIAVHPQTGALYGLNMSTDALYTIDPATQAATLVGTGLGINTTNGVAGLDFTPDGRLFAIAFGYGSTTSSSLFEIDITTGLAGPSLGEVGFIASSLAYIPEPAVAGVPGLVALLSRRRIRKLSQ